MLKYTVKISHDCSYMFRSTWTIIREPMPNLAKVTILCCQNARCNNKKMIEIFFININCVSFK